MRRLAFQHAQGMRKLAHTSAVRTPLISRRSSITSIIRAPQTLPYAAKNRRSIVTLFKPGTNFYTTIAYGLGLIAVESCLVHEPSHGPSREANQKNSQKFLLSAMRAAYCNRVCYGEWVFYMQLIVARCVLVPARYFTSFPTLFGKLLCVPESIALVPLAIVKHDTSFTARYWDFSINYR